MDRQYWLLISVLLSVLFLAASTSMASPDTEIVSDVVSNERWQIEATIPKGWQATKSPYPNVVVRLTRSDRSAKILISAEKRRPQESVRDYANRTKRALSKTRYKTSALQRHSSTGAWWIELEDKRASLRQAFFYLGDNAYSIVLSAANAKQKRRYLRAFDFCLRSIEIPSKATEGAFQKRLSNKDSSSTMTKPQQKPSPPK